MVYTTRRMGSLLACCFRERYRKVTEDIVLETNDDESRGIYWFKDLPKATTARKTSGGTEGDFRFMKRIHRFSAMIESKVGDAAAILPRAPEWREMYEDTSTGFKMCRFSYKYSRFFLPVLIVLKRATPG